MSSINLTMPDGAIRTVPANSKGNEVAASISKSLAKEAVAIYVDGVLKDLDTTLVDGMSINFITKKDEAALELIRHDLAHVMAQAVTEIFPDAKPTIGPVITNGFYYDFHCSKAFTNEDLAKIEKRMHTIVDDGIPLVREVWEREKAIEFFAKNDEPFKVELVEAIPANEDVSVYHQGEFLDLCRGPHMPSTKYAGNAFKLTSVAGSYWRGDAKNAQLQRIYGTAWRTQDELKDYLFRQEEAIKRDHRKLGRSMHLFHLQDEAAGCVFWHPNGWTLYRTLQNYIRDRLFTAGYQEINTPQLISRSLWEKSGHWSKFRENMYLVENEEGMSDYVKEPEQAAMSGLKPMNCPGHVLVYNQGSKSYRDLPLRYTEFGGCHRCEPKGALHGIMRVRAFTQDDAHIFCTDEQIVSETVNFAKLLDLIYRDLGFSDYTINYADRPAVRAGSDADWDKAENALLKACEIAKIDYKLNPGEGAFYGPKLEFVLKDALDREWQCGTLQVDYVLPESLGATYTDQDGERKVPAMLHRAILGSLERFIGILIEHTNGHLPLWLSDPQIIIATITSKTENYAKELYDKLTELGFRVRLDVRNEKINYKIREHSTAKVPILAVLGEKEEENNTATLRRIGSQKTESISITDMITTITNEALPPHQRD